MPRLLSPAEIAAALSQDLSDWSTEGTPADTLVRAVKARTFLDGIALVSAVAAAAEELNHHPDIDIRWTTVTFRLSTHSEGGLTEHDLALARRIDSLA